MTPPAANSSFRFDAKGQPMMNLCTMPLKLVGLLPSQIVVIMLTTASEAQHLESLREYRILNSAPEQA
jgi:hypothetical protein